MSGKFLIYAIVVTALSTTASWGKFIASASNGSRSSMGSSYGGSSWSSNTGGFSGSSGSHK